LGDNNGSVYLLNIQIEAYLHKYSLEEKEEINDISYINNGFNIIYLSNNKLYSASIKPQYSNKLVYSFDSVSKISNIINLSNGGDILLYSQDKIILYNIPNNKITKTQQGTFGNIKAFTENDNRYYLSVEQSGNINVLSQDLKQLFTYKIKGNIIDFNCLSSANKDNNSSYFISLSKEENNSVTLITSYRLELVNDRFNFIPIKSYQSLNDIIQLENTFNGKDILVLTKNDGFFFFDFINQKQEEINLKQSSRFSEYQKIIYFRDASRILLIKLNGSIEVWKV